MNQKEHPMDVTLTKEPSYYSLGNLKFWALGDRLVIEEDEFRTGYECTVCNGSGNTPCDACNGSGASSVVRGARCPTCAGSGLLKCPSCEGKGGLLIAPEISQRRPTTGRIVSLGPACKELKLGQSVLYSNFAGYVIDLERAGRKVTLRILHETEILCGMEGQLELRNLKGKTEIALASP